MADVILFFSKLQKGKEDYLLPISLLTIAAPLVKAGFSVKIIDQRLEKRWREILTEEIAKKPFLVGFSVMTGLQILNALEASRIVKEKSQIPVVWGGVHPSLLPEQTLTHPLIDIVIVREGEETLLELVDKLKNNESLDNVLGLTYKKNNEVFCNPNRPFIDLESLPSIPYHLVEVEKYIKKITYTSGHPGREIVLFTSRGCPHRCGFCYNKEYNKRRWRGKTAQRVIEEMEKLIKDYQINSFNIQDDEFFVDIKRAEKICQAIIDKGWQIELSSCCRIDYVAERMDDNFLHLLEKAGFKTLFLGIESGSPRVEKIICKDITNEQVIKSMEKMHRFNINAKYTFMAGFPDETIADLYQTTDLILKMKKINPYVRIPPWRVFTVYPGIALYDLSVEAGFKPPRSLEEWAEYDFSTIKNPWVTPRMKKIIENVIYSIKFLRLRNKRLNNTPLHLLLKLYSALIDWRWGKHWLSFMPEKFLLKFR
jgi:radical SAM superfamily enzyme YgiQ (UPF0313 family)